jgi:hypothetical protein
MLTEKRLTVAFAILLGAFICRVLMQGAQAVSHVPWLPAFARWQSGLLPYPILLLSQVAIIAGSLSFLAKVRKGTLSRRRQLGQILACLGGLYLAFDILRLVLGATILSGHRFFDNPIPAGFHVVLALMMLIWAGFHLKRQA